jgi:hypothetical protein
MSTSGSSDDRRPLVSDAQVRTGDAIRTIVEATALKTSDAFFSTLVRELAGALGVRHALIAECSDIASTQVRTLAFWSEERFLEPAVYGFTGIKCDVTVSGADEVLRSSAVRHDARDHRSSCNTRRDTASRR